MRAPPRLSVTGFSSEDLSWLAPLLRRVLFPYVAYDLVHGGDDSLRLIELNVMRGAGDDFMTAAGRPRRLVIVKPEPRDFQAVGSGPADALSLQDCVRQQRFAVRQHD